MESQTAPSSTATKKQRGPLIVILIVVGAIIVVGGAIAVWKLSSSSDDKAGPPAGQSAKGLFKAWQAGNQAGAAKHGTVNAVTAIFAVNRTDGTGLQFDGCKATGSDPFPKQCVWSRPGGQLTMTVNKRGDKAIVTKVTNGPAGLPPDTGSTG